MHFTIEPIGIIHSPFTEKEACPIQGATSNQAIGRVELSPQYEAGLETIESFSHLILFYVFHQAGEVILCRPTFLDDQPHGVFASRHPCRPNSIGISIVELRSRNNNILEVGDIDVLDGTPLIDIKPYVPRFDHRPTANNGWVADKEFTPKPAGRE
ncbi:MAG: tRNA (N6-threonylcarbamoyladenosine(37)-N6)-methyltransferase TrmO [Desulfobulbaceae bacterium]|nr:MAG: tRNA (N6-threonylcarbamoyladenosine(37)-N6)-methyltransferase TrmO [Desulfobulbaceae bacterium]